MASTNALAGLAAGKERRQPIAADSAPSRALLMPAEMLVVERKRVPYFAAGSGGMQQSDRLSQVA
jgi:hypothetical protein